VAWIVIMGVAGCGKSSLGAAVASQAGLAFIEGDTFHAPQALAKMRAGIPLSDADRTEWLDRLGVELARRPEGAVLACSALKHAYRDRLRRAVPDLKFVYLEIDRETAHLRVAARGAAHMFPASLVHSQFTALESPNLEPGVLTVCATDALADLCAKAYIWMATRCAKLAPAALNK